MDTIKIVKPIGCQLWTDKYLDQSDLAPRRRVKEYIHDDPLIRALMKCSQCDQKYYYEFYEEIDWDDGNDQDYWMYIPIEDDEQTNAKLNALFFIPIA